MVKLSETNRQNVRSLPMTVPDAAHAAEDGCKRLPHGWTKGKTGNITVFKEPSSPRVLWLLVQILDEFVLPQLSFHAAKLCL